MGKKVRRRVFSEVTEEVGGNCMLSKELLGGSDGSGTFSPRELRVGCRRGWNLVWHCYLCKHVQSFPGTFEVDVITLAEYFFSGKGKNLQCPQLMSTSFLLGHFCTLRKMEMKPLLYIFMISGYFLCSRYFMFS